MSSKQILKIHAVFIVMGMTTAMPAFAQGLTYEPINPAFGGNPLNGTFLLGDAAAQNQFTSSGGSTPNINFPDITIDLGGAGGTAAEEPEPASTTPDADTSSTASTTPSG